MGRKNRERKGDQTLKLSKTFERIGSSPLYPQREPDIELRRGGRSEGSRDPSLTSPEIGP